MLPTDQHARNSPYCSKLRRGIADGCSTKWCNQHSGHNFRLALKNGSDIARSEAQECLRAGREEEGTATSEVGLDRALRDKDGVVAINRIGNHSLH